MTKARDIASAIPAPSTVSSAELGYLDGVTSAIQTQIDTKAPSSTAVTLTGTQTLTNKTLTNPVIASVVNNTLTSTTGDMIYASAANTPARLGIGSSAQVLTVAAGVPSWTTPSSGSMTLLSTTALSGTSTTVSSISQDYVNLFIQVRNITFSTADRCKISSGGAAGSFSGTTANAAFSSDDFWSNISATTHKIATFVIPNYTDATYLKAIQAFGAQSLINQSFMAGGRFDNKTSAVSAITITSVGGTATMSTGEILIWGVK